MDTVPNVPDLVSLERNPLLANNDAMVWHHRLKFIDRLKSRELLFACSLLDEKIDPYFNTARCKRASPKDYFLNS